MARIGEAFAPAELLVTAEHEARTPWGLRVDIPDRPGGLALLIRALSTLHVHVVATAMLAAATLVEADHFEVTNATEGEDDDDDVLRLQWTADRHVVLHRDWAPFARAEKTRASALLRLAASVSRMAGDVEALSWVEQITGDATVWIRLARPEDADAVAAMHERCSPQSRYQRYLGGANEWRDISLRRLTGGHRGATLVVMSEEAV